MNNQAPLIQEIDRFLTETGMGPSYFGKKAVNNSELVSRLRAGKRILVETDAAVRQFIVNNSPDAARSSDGSRSEVSLPANNVGTDSPNGNAGKPALDIPQINTNAGAGE